MNPIIDLTILYPDVIGAVDHAYDPNRGLILGKRGNSLNVTAGHVTLSGVIVKYGRARHQEGRQRISLADAASRYNRFVGQPDQPTLFEISSPVEAPGDQLTEIFAAARALAGLCRAKGVTLDLRFVINS